MTVKLFVKHPHIQEKHVKLTAASLTLLGGGSHYIPAMDHFEAIFFALAGCIAIYEPYLVHEVKLIFRDVETAFEDSDQ